MKSSLLLRLIGFWPPYLGTGIRVRRFSKDMRLILVEMRYRWWNRNYVGTHFGGSLYAMTDPFYMLMLMKNLGSDYIIWDKSASIHYKKACKTTVYARFELDDHKIHHIQSQLAQLGKVEQVFTIPITDSEGTTIAVVEKTIYIRAKNQAHKS